MPLTAQQVGAAFFSFAKLAKKVSALGLLSDFFTPSPSTPLCVPCWPSDPITNSKFTSLCLAWSLSSSKEAQPWAACSLSEADRWISESWAGDRSSSPTSSRPIPSPLEPLLYVAAMATAGENTWPRGSLPRPTAATARDGEGTSGTGSEQLERKGPDLSQPASAVWKRLTGPEFKPQRLETSF